MAAKWNDPHAFPVGNTQGMALRDYFAAQVVGHLAVAPQRDSCSVEEDARYAYRYADALIEARKLW